MIKKIIHIAKLPLYLIILSYGVYAICLYTIPIIFPEYATELNTVFSIIIQTVTLLGIYWIFIRCLTFAKLKLQNHINKEGGKTSLVLLDFLIEAVKVIILLSFLSFVVDLLPLPKQYNNFTEKLISVLIIMAIARILIKSVKVAEKIFLAKYNTYLSNHLLIDKARTQITLLVRIAIILIITVSFGSAMLLFETVKHFGASILTSAGILSVISAFAIQRPLRNLADSVQIIFNKLIKINDSVLIENQFGMIEEINLYYVVIRIWDLRSLIVPINYFIEKPFINFSRISKEILCTIKLYVDYTLPLQPLKYATEEIAAQSSYWDKKIFKLEVTDLKEFTMELRILLSAKTADEAWNLRCEVREKLIEFIIENHPQHLPKFRTVTSLLNTRV